MAAHLVDPFGLVQTVSAWTLEQSLRFDPMYVTGRVRTMAQSSSVAPFYEDGAVLIRKGRIEQVGPRESIPVPEGASQYVMEEWTIMPGIIDSHVHETSSHKMRQTLLTQGVTSVGDVGSSVDDLESFQDRRDEYDRILAGVYGAGPMIGPENGYPGRVWPERYGISVDNPRKAARVAESLLDQGASMLKIGFEPGPNGAWPLLDFQVARAIVDVARDRDVVVRCHAQDLDGLNLAIQAGVDTVEHTVLHGSSGPLFTGEKGALVPGPDYSDALKRMADAGIVLVPTLQMAARADWDGSGALGAVRVFREAGGEVGLGTDAPMRGVKHGMPLEEMRLMEQAGMDNQAILRAATMGAARAMGQEKEVGSLEPGKSADLICLVGDPVNGYDQLQGLGPVMRQGEIHPETYR